MLPPPPTAARRLFMVLLLGVLVVGAAVPSISPAASICAMPRKPQGLGSASVVRVVDGDTLILDAPERRSLRVRLIGVDSPEVHAGAKLERDSRRSGKDAEAIQALGAQASEFTKKYLRGQSVQIERDVTATDRYGRTLLYVWRGDELYNVVIVREGFAALMTIQPNVRYADVLAACYRAARGQRRGLWALDDVALGLRGGSVPR